MRAFYVAAIVAAGVVLSAGHVFAQGVVAPAAGCTATPAQLEANKKAAMAFPAANAERVALADPTYKQHNPAFIKGGRKRGSATTNTSRPGLVVRGTPVRRRCGPPPYWRHGSSRLRVTPRRSSWPNVTS